MSEARRGEIGLMAAIAGGASFGALWWGTSTPVAAVVGGVVAAVVTGVALSRVSRHTDQR